MRAVTRAFCRVLVAACLSAVGPAAANPACMPEAAMMATLSERYGEIEVWRGRNSGGELVLTVGRTGTWSIVAIGRGVACLRASGVAYDLARPI